MDKYQPNLEKNRNDEGNKMAKARDGFDRLRSDQQKARELRLKHAKHDQEIISNLPGFYTQEVFDALLIRDIVAIRVAFSDKSDKVLLKLYKDRDEMFTGLMKEVLELKNHGITEEKIIRDTTAGYINYYKKNGRDLEL